MRDDDPSDDQHEMRPSSEARLLYPGAVLLVPSLRRDECSSPYPQVCILGDLRLTSIPSPGP